MNETILIKFKDGKGDGRMARFVNPDAVLHTDSHITLGGTTIYKSEVDWITYGDPVTGIAGIKALPGKIKALSDFVQYKGLRE